MTLGEGGRESVKGAFRLRLEGDERVEWDLYWVGCLFTGFGGREGSGRGLRLGRSGFECIPDRTREDTLLKCVPLTLGGKMLIWQTHTAGCSKITDGVNFRKEPDHKEKEKTRCLHESARGLPREWLRRKVAFIHSLRKAQGRRPRKYLRCVQASLSPSTHNLRW